PYMGQHPVLVQHPFHQDFQLPAGFLAPEQARRYDRGIVEYHQVARPQVLQQLGEPPVLQGTAGAIETQQPAGSAFGQRMTGDEAVRQVEMEIADAHERHTGIAEKGANGSGKPPSRPWKPLTGAAKPPYTPRGLSDASVAELVDAADSKPASGARVGVRFSPGAPFPREWSSTAQTRLKRRSGAGSFVGDYCPPLPWRQRRKQALLRIQIRRRVQRRDAAGASRGTGLAVDLIAHVTGSEHARDIGRGGGTFGGAVD